MAYLRKEQEMVDENPFKDWNHIFVPYCTKADALSNHDVKLKSTNNKPAWRSTMIKTKNLTKIFTTAEVETIALNHVNLEVHIFIKQGIGYGDGQ